MNKIQATTAIGLCLLASATQPIWAHVGESPSVHDTVAGIIGRMKRELSTNELRSITVQRVEQFLTPPERDILATKHISFRVNVPVRVSILRDTKLGHEPFWLRARGFQPTSINLKEGNVVFDVWQKDFDAGRIGLGIHSFSGEGDHYLVTLAPKTPGDKIVVNDLYPGQLRLAEFRAGVEPYIDQATVLKAVPPELAGQTLIRTDTDREEDARLVNIFRWTDYPASARPDQVVLTWSDDPRTTQTIQWRTSTKVKRGCVLYQKKSDSNRFKPRQPKRASAATTHLETPTLLNDLVVHRHTAVLRGLSPGHDLRLFSRRWQQRGLDRAG